MADDVTANPGTGGAVLATDDVGGRHFARIKIVEGADGVNDGDISASNPLPVELRTPAGDSAMDDANNAVNAVVVAALPAGTAAIGKLAANSGVNIGDVGISAIASGVNVIGRLAANSGFNIGDVRLTGAVTPNGDQLIDDTNDAVRVNVVTGAAGTSMTDDAAFTPGSTSVVPVAGTYRSSRDSVDDNDAGALAMTQKRGLYTTLETPNGDSAMDDTNDAVKIVQTSGALLLATVASGTNVFGRLAANSGVNIGDVGISAIASGNNVIGKVAGNSGTVIGDVNVAMIASGVNIIGRLAANSGFNIGDVRLTGAVTPAGDQIIDDTNDALRVNVVAGAAGGTAMTDDAAFTPGSTSVTPVAGTYRSTRDSLDDNDAGAVAITQKRGLYTSPESPNGDSLVDDTNDALRITQQSGSLLLATVASGTNVFGRLAANSGVNIGDVGISAIASGNNVIGKIAGNSGTTIGDVNVLTIASGGNIIGRLAANSGFNIGDIRLTGAVTPNGDQIVDDTNDAIRVNVVAGAAAGGTSMTDDAAFTPGSTAVTPVAGTYRSSRDVLDDNDAGAIALTSRRGVYTSPESPNGDSLVDDTNDALKVTQTSGALLLATIASGNNVIGKIAAGSGTVIGDVNIAMIASGVNVIGRLAANSGFNIGDVRLTGAVTPNGDQIVDDTNDAIRVNVVAGAAGGTAMTDDAAFTPGSTSVTPVAGTYRSSRDSMDDNDAGAIALTAKRGVYTSPESPNGDSLVDDTNDALKITQTSGALLLATIGSANNVIGRLSANSGFNIGDVRLTGAVTPNGDSMLDDTNDAVRVNVVAGAAGGTAMTDDAAFTPGSTSVTPVAGTYRSSRDALDDNDAGAIALTEKRGVYVSPESPNGDSLVDDTNDALKITQQSGSLLLATIASGNNVIGKIAAGSGTVIGDVNVAMIASGVNIIGRLAANSGFNIGDIRLTGAVTPAGDQIIDDTNDAFRVNVVAGAAGGTAMTDDAAFTPGSTSVTPVAGTYRSSRDSMDDNDAGAIALTQKRGVYTSPESPNGDSLVDDTNDALRITQTSGALLLATIASGNNVIGKIAAGSGTVIGDVNVAMIASGVNVIGRLAANSGFNIGDIRLTGAVTPNGDQIIDDTNDAFRVNIVAGGAGTSMSDDAAFTPGSTSVTPVAGTYRSSRDSLDDNDAGALAITQKRGLYTSPESPNGDSLVDDTNDALKITQQSGSLLLATVASGTNVFGRLAANSGVNIGDIRLTGLVTPNGDQLVDDTNDVLRVAILVNSAAEIVVDNVGFTDGTTKLSMGGYIFDETAGTALTENDAAAARVDAKRAQVYVLEDETTRGQRATVTSSKALKTDASNSTLFAIDTPIGSGGLSRYSTVLLSGTNATMVKSAAGQIYAIYAFNINSAAIWLKLYDRASNPTPGTDTPILRFAIPGNLAGGGFVMTTDGKGCPVSTGIAFSATMGINDSDATAIPNSGQATVNILYK